jgi:hypothetical protein
VTKASSAVIALHVVLASKEGVDGVRSVGVTGSASALRVARFFPKLHDPWCSASQGIVSMGGGMTEEAKETESQQGPRHRDV